MKKKTFIGIIIFVALFLASSYLVRQYTANIQGFRPGIYGAVAYLFLAGLDVVTVPLLVPFIPLATQIYGFWLTVALTLAGWLAGMVVAFYISRRLGKTMLKKYAQHESVVALRRFIPKERIFSFTILARIFLPHDIGSYYLGTVTNISFRKYMLGSAIGSLPLAAFLVYLGELPTLYEIGIFAGGLIIISAFVYFGRKNQ